MLRKKDMLKLDEIFPLTRGKRVKNRAELIQVAKRVSTALKKEGEYLVEEHAGFSIKCL